MASTRMKFAVRYEIHKSWANCARCLNGFAKVLCFGFAFVRFFYLVVSWLGNRGASSSKRQFAVVLANAQSTRIHRYKLAANSWNKLKLPVQIRFNGELSASVRFMTIVKKFFWLIYTTLAKSFECHKISNKHCCLHFI